MESQNELAAYFQAHRGDPDEWDEPEEAPAPARPRPAGLSVSIAVRFTPSEADAIRRTARQEGITYSELVRKAAQRYTQPTQVFEASREYTLPALETSTLRTLSSTPSRRESVLPSFGTETRSSAVSPKPDAPAIDQRN